MAKHKRPSPFRSAAEEVKRWSPKKYIPEYPLAFTDQEFLLREDLRPIRLLLEFQKAEMRQQEHGIHSTVVVFGSARTKPLEVTQVELAKALEFHNAHPRSHLAKERLKLAQQQFDTSKYYEESRRLGHIITKTRRKNNQLDFVIMTGGGPGIMEAANRGAFEVNGKSVGLGIFLPGTEEHPNPYITPELNFHFHYFALRKMHFLIRARALVFFPGGYGTMDELFEVLTLMQTKKIEKLPLILFHKKFWDTVFNFEALVEMGMVSPEDLHLFEFADTAEEAWEKICAFYNIEVKTGEPAKVKVTSKGKSLMKV